MGRLQGWCVAEVAKIFPNEPNPSRCKLDLSWGTPGTSVKMVVLQDSSFKKGEETTVTQQLERNENM